MADANFWRDLANQFRAIQDPHGRLFAEWTFIQKIKEGPPGDAYWVVDGNDETRVRLEFEALARRGGRAIDTGGDDSRFAWLESLRKERSNLDVVRPSFDQGSDGPEVIYRRVRINGVANVSADFCKVLESRALDAEQLRETVQKAVAKNASALSESGSDPFWVRMAHRFRDVDPYELLSLTWRVSLASPTSGSLEWGLLGAGENVAESFMQLAAEAARRAQPSARDHIVMWFQMLKDSALKVENNGKLWTLRRVCEVSAILCSRQDSRQEGPAEPAEPKVLASPAYSTRAKWLQDRLRERAWDRNHPRGFGGPDRKTVQRMLDGLAVSPDSLRKLVIALNKNKIGKRIELLDIPID